MYRVVLDAVILLRGLVNPHSICGMLLSEYTHRYQVIFSEETRKALVLLPFHPLLLAKYPHLSKTDPRQAGRLIARAEKVHVQPDHSDNIFIAAAIAAKADYLVCEDPALLALRGRSKIPIIDARAFVTLLASGSAL